jgi:uncharacterized protein YigE (DUF2233 family)
MIRALFASLGMLSALFTAACTGSSPSGPPACRTEAFDGLSFSVCDLRTDLEEKPAFRLAWNDRDGRPLGSLKALRRDLGPDARRVMFAMNAGMYHPGQRPVGLLMRNGTVITPLETRKGSGNFYDLPNGVFSVDREGRYRIEETGAFAASGRRPVWATQSGPLLVRDGVIHPVAARGARAMVRNAVLGCGPDLARFVISNDPVTMEQLARFGRDHLRCPTALYLDGAVSALWAPELKRLDEQKGLGPLLYVMSGR